MGLSRTVSKIDGDFSRKSQNFPTPCILRPRWMGYLGIRYRRRSQKNRNDGATRWSKKFYDWFSRLDTIAYRRVTDRQTDRQSSLASTAQHSVAQAITHFHTSLSVNRPLNKERIPCWKLLQEFPSTVTERAILWDQRPRRGYALYGVSF